jgi:ABC-type multidrug transport system permease subunit
LRRTSSLLGRPLALRSLSWAMFVGFVRDRAALAFSILLPVLFLVLFGSIYKSADAPKVNVIEVGRVGLLDQAVSIGLLVGSFTTSQQAAMAITIVPMAFLGGAFVPLDFAPAWIRDVSYAMPLRYLVTRVQNVMARGEDAAAAPPAVGIVLGLAAVFTLISVRAIRWDSV